MKISKNQKTDTLTLICVIKKEHEQQLIQNYLYC